MRLGDVVPADARLLKGDLVEVDQSALTGESLPAVRKSGEAVFSGSIIRQGEIGALVYATGANTYFGKTAQLVQEAHTVSHFQRAVLKIGNYLIMLAVALVAVIVTVAIFCRDPILTTLQFALVLTVAAIPVAMPTVLSVTMAVGARLLRISRPQRRSRSSREVFISNSTRQTDGSNGSMKSDQETVPEPKLGQQSLHDRLRELVINIWSRRTSVIASFAVAAILLYLILRFGLHMHQAEIPLPATLALGGTPLVYELLRKLFRREFGSDLLAGISIVTSVLLGEYLVGSIVVLMFAGGEALETYALRSASSVLRALAKRMPSLAHRKQGAEIMCGDLVQRYAPELQRVLRSHLKPLGYGLRRGAERDRPGRPKARRPPPSISAQVHRASTTSGAPLQ